MPVSVELTLKAIELKEKYYHMLRELTLVDTLMPDDYNAPYQVIKQLLETVNQTPTIPHREIKMNDDVDAQHVLDLREICYQLWFYIYQELKDPYIYDPDFKTLKDILDNMRIPKHGDELRVDEWNSISTFCRKIIDLLLRTEFYSIVALVMFE